jgi:hypothetical protein
MRLVQMKPVGDCSGGINLDAWVFRQVSRWWTLCKECPGLLLEPLLRQSLSQYINLNVRIVTYSGFSIHDGTLLHSKSQYTTVDYSQQLYNTRPNSTSSLTQLLQITIGSAPNTTSELFKLSRTTVLSAEVWKP